MTRKEFLRNAGAGALFAITATCLGSCTKEDASQYYLTNDLELDLTQTQYAKLLVDGNYIVKDKVVIAKGIDGKYYAATVVCSHELRHEVTYDKANDEYYCTAHAARFDLSGNGLNKQGEKNLKIYQTRLDNNILTIFA